MVIPVEQTCPVCGDRFMGSDMVGMPCMPCASGGLLDENLLTSLAYGNTYDSNATTLEVDTDGEEGKTATNDIGVPERRGDSDADGHRGRDDRTKDRD